MDLMDYSEAAVERPINDLNPTVSLMVSQTPPMRRASRWEMVTGPHGTLVMTDVSFETDIARFFWADDATPAFHQYDSTILDAPDDKPSGPADGALLTPKENGSVQHTLTRRILYFQAPDLALESANPCGGCPTARCGPVHNWQRMGCRGLWRRRVVTGRQTPVPQTAYLWMAPVAIRSVFPQKTQRVVRSTARSKAPTHRMIVATAPATPR